MLVLGFKQGEESVVTHNGERLKVCLVEVKHKTGFTRIGFDGPKSFSVHRKEVQDRIDRELLTSNEHAKEWERE